MVGAGCVWGHVLDCGCWDVRNTQLAANKAWMVGLMTYSDINQSTGTGHVGGLLAIRNEWSAGIEMMAG